MVETVAAFAGSTGIVAPMSRHRPPAAAGVLVAAVLLVGGVGCSSTPDDTASGASNSSVPATTADDAAGTTTTSSVVTSVPDAESTVPTTETGSSGSDRWTAPGSESPLSLAVGSPEPEFPAGKDGTVESIPDGRYAVIVRQVDATASRALVDVVELFLDDEAIRQALADGQIGDPEELLTNFYVRNPSPKMRDVAVNSGVSVRGPGGGSSAMTTLVDRLSSAPQIPYLIDVKGGRISSIRIPDVVDPTAG